MEIYLISFHSKLEAILCVDKSAGLPFYLGVKYRLFLIPIFLTSFENKSLITGNKTWKQFIDS